MARLNGIDQINGAPPAPANTVELPFTAGDITNLVPGTAYQGFVRACKGALCSAWSDPVPFTTEALNPPANTPMNVNTDYFRSVAINSTNFTLEWRRTPALGATTFRLDIYGPGGFLSSQTFNWTSSAQLFTQLNAIPDRVYSAYLRACNNEGCSDARWVSVHTSAGGDSPPVITSVVEGVSNREWDISWTYTPVLPTLSEFILEHTSPGLGGLVWVPVSVPLPVPAPIPPAPYTLHFTLPTVPPSIAFRIKACRQPSGTCTDYSNIGRAQ